MNSNNNDTEVPEDQLEEQAFHLNAEEFVSQPKARSIKNTGKDLTMKQMFDISEKLMVGQSDEIYGVITINWEDFSWKHLSFIGDEEVISLSHAKVYLFSDSVLCLGKMNENPESNHAWEDRLT